MPEKNQEYEITIEDYGNDGEGIGHIDGMAVFVKDAAKGDHARVKIIKVKKNYAYGRVMEILVPSGDRVSPICSHARACGGCSLMHISYEKQLEWKQEKVRAALERIGGVKNAGELMEPVVGLEDGTASEEKAGTLAAAEMKSRGLRYRNKGQFPVGRKKDGSLAIGFYGRHSHSIVDTDCCYLQSEKMDSVLQLCRQWAEQNGIEPYDEEKHQGLLRHIVIREGRESGQIQVCLVLKEDALPQKAGEKLTETLKKVEGMTSIVLNINPENTNRILGDKLRVLQGKETITDRIGELSFEIGPLSFYQVNPVQTRRMYQKALEYASLTGQETVFDLYCGIGTISLFLAKKARQVYGIELVPEAIEDAKRNAARNGITNASFYAGETETLLPQLYEKEGIKADVIVVDPPRKGCDETAIATMIRMAPKRIVYVSCDPATLARDIARLREGGYELQKVCAFDNFCQSTHVEVCCLLEQQKRTKDFVQIGIDAEEYYRIKDSEENKE